ncbi:hypothetical protein HOY80DRAFT_1038341 [Tuber brumale]|nr:hypothetical protein HOY80DRAFT_1038341 [Tuber brumale]
MPLSTRPNNTCSAKAMTHAHTTSAIAITNPILDSRHIRKCLKKYQDFHAGRGTLRCSSGNEALTLNISIKEFLHWKRLLHNDGDEEGFRSPKYSYHASSQRLITEHSASLLYEKVVSTMVEGFIFPWAKLPPSIKRKISVVRNQKFYDFSGVHEGSEKVPDLALLVVNNSGFPELKTKTVSLVLLVKLEESLAYQSPMKNLTNLEITRLGFPRLGDISTEPFKMDKSWRLDLVTNSAAQTSHIALDNMRDSPNSGLWLSQLIDVGDLNDDKICFDWNDFLDAIESCIRQTAVNRCVRSIRDAGGWTNLFDRDYQPSSPTSF